MKIIVKCKTVDYYGFCGREFHPTDAHIGQQFEVISMSEESTTYGGHVECSDNVRNEKDAVEYLAHREAVRLDEGGSIFKVLRCTADGKTLVDFIDFEVEVLSVSGLGGAR